MQRNARKKKVIYAPYARHVQVKCLVLNISKDIINFTADIAAALKIRQQLLASLLACLPEESEDNIYHRISGKKIIHKSKYRK